MSTERIGKYLSARIYDRPASRKTDVWDVLSNDGTPLTRVAWYGPWRQYVVEPETGTVFNATCLRDIVVFLDRVNAAQRVTA